MAKKLVAVVKLQIPAGKANPAPPVGPALGQHGVNIMDFCKQFNGGKGNVRRSYAINSWFGSRRDEPWEGRKLIDFQNAGKEPSRMGYLIELQSSVETGEHKGEQGNKDKGKRKAIANDSVWEHADDERYGLYHRKAGDMHGHVIFVDGHIESLYKTNKQGDDYQTQNTKIGTAEH